MKESTAGIRIDCGNGKENWVSLYRDCWSEREYGDGGRRHRAILMEAHKKDADNWYIGILNPDKEKPKKLRNALVRKLGEGDFDKALPWSVWMDEDKRNWSVLVPDLHEECGMEGGGEITSYFVDRFVEVATEAIPVIDGLEGTET